MFASVGAFLTVTNLYRPWHRACGSASRANIDCANAPSKAARLEAAKKAADAADKAASYAAEAVEASDEAAIAATVLKAFAGTRRVI